MNVAFSGGLVYEFTQEPNNYGLVQLLPTNDVQILRDFLQLKNQLSSLPGSSRAQSSSLVALEGRKRQTRSSPRCEERYSNLDVSRGIPESLAGDLIRTGVKVRKGKYVELSALDVLSPYKVLDVHGNSYLSLPRVEVREIINANWTVSKTRYSTTAASGTYIDFGVFDLNTNSASAGRTILTQSFAMIFSIGIIWLSIAHGAL